MSRTLSLLLVLPALTLPFAGCGKQEATSTPVACLEPATEWREALEAVPGEVTISGTPISECLPADQPAAQQETVGRTVVEVATELAAERPKGTVAYQAGYLVGAIERGAAETQGIHSTLADRVTTAASNGLESQPAPVRSAYEEGREAGLESG